MLERDPTPMPRRPTRPSTGSAAALPRCVTAMRSWPAALDPRHERARRLDALLDAGRHRDAVRRDLPTRSRTTSREPGDDELVMIACRRTTFEWVLRRIAIDEGNVSFEVGRAVVGLVADDRAPGGHAASGSTTAPSIDSDLIVVAAGRRSALPDWLAAIGVDVPDDEEEDTGIVYLSRFYRLREGEEYPPRSGPSAPTSATSSTASSSATTTRSRSRLPCRPPTTSSAVSSPTRTTSKRRPTPRRRRPVSSTAAPRRSPTTST